MLIEFSTFLLIFFYVIGILMSIPLSITYSNNFSSFASKDVLSFIGFSWFSFVFLFVIILKNEFPYPLKTKNLFDKFFQFRFVQRDERGFRLSDCY
jgi:hypothetical protein